MSLNVSKTKLMYISSRHKQQILANCDRDVSICDSKIQVSSVEKLLGVKISNSLCCDAHIDQLIKKCNSYLLLLSRIKVFLSRRNRILFYNSYNLPHLDLCCISCGNCSSTLEDKLVKFQTTAARVILECDFYTLSSDLFKELNWQTFPERVTNQKAFLKCRIINNICPDTRSTNCNQLYTPKPNCELFRKSFMNSGADIWNSLPLHFKNATSVHTFKSLYLKWKRLNDH